MKRIKIKAKIVQQKKPELIQPKKHNNLLIMQLMDKRDPSYALWNGIIIRVATMDDITKANTFLKHYADPKCSESIYLDESDLNPLDDATFIYAVDEYIPGVLVNDRYIIRRLGTIEDYMQRLYRHMTSMDSLYRNLPLTFMDKERLSVDQTIYDAIRKSLINHNNKYKVD